MKQSPEEYRKVAGAVWDLVQERAADIDSDRGSTKDSECPHAIYAWKFPDGCYELLTYGEEESLFIDERLFAYAERIANAEGVPVHVAERF